MGQIRNGPSSLGCRKSRITGIYRLIFELFLRLQCYGQFLGELTQIMPFPINLVIFISSKRKGSVCCCKWVPCVNVSIFEVHSVCTVFWSDQLWSFPTLIWKCFVKDTDWKISSYHIPYEDSAIVYILLTLGSSPVNCCKVHTMP